MAKPPPPRDPAIQVNEGLHQASQLIGRGRYPEAEALLLQLRTLAPLHPYIAYNLGVSWWETGRQDEAVRAWRQALAAKPDFGPAALNLGNALHSLGQQREALRYSKMAVQLLPNLAGAWHNLSLVLLDLHEAPAALETNDRCLALEPDSPQALAIRVGILTELKRRDDCDIAARKLLSIPGQQDHGGALCALYVNAARCSRWQELPELRSRLLASAEKSDRRIGPLSLAWVTDDARLLRTLTVARSEGMAGMAVQPRPRREIRDRITIGYLSPDFREHPVAHMLIDVLQAHDRNRFRILTLGVLPKYRGPLNTRIDSLTDGHIDLSKSEDSAAAELIRKAGVDVLVDLAGATQWGRNAVLAARPTPVQVLWLGCPCSTGAAWYDAFLVDDVVAPMGYEAYCSEPLLRLPCCYHPISTGLGSPDTTLTRAAVGLPEDAVVLGLLLNAVKVGPEVTGLLGRLLRDLPQTVLWMTSEGPDAAERIRGFFREQGVDPARIIFAAYESDRGRYLGRQRLVDLMIDTFPYGGHSTSGEAMAQGVPVVTRAGGSIHSRVAASMQHRLGMDELVAWNSEDYEALIRRLITDSAQRQRIRRLCGERAQALAADQGRVLTWALEEAFVRLLDEAPR